MGIVIFIVVYVNEDVDNIIDYFFNTSLTSYVVLHTSYELKSTTQQVSL